MDVTIALDAMGGDHGPTEIIPSALHVLSKHDNLHLVLVGQEEILLKVLAENNTVPNERISIRHASETVEMHELPSKALRKKKDSSMRV
ncbi:MAG: phosphate acyltransferase, partial [Gammaproteobacteria bacterium]|nr:phosphate acyltransferase [Gammaproteobacteria bacterium]